MKPIVIRGMGAVSPAGWSVTHLRQALAEGTPIPAQTVEGPRPRPARKVPKAVPRPPILNHPRLRRCSPISQFAAAAAEEALKGIECARSDLGIVFSTMCGSVGYSRRFYAEALENPATASPILFPETVFNAPVSHVASALTAPVPTVTLVGDSSVFLQALALGARWVATDFVQCSLVIAAEEVDWPVLEGWKAFSDDAIPAEGAAALCLGRGRESGEDLALAMITDPIRYGDQVSRLSAARQLRDSMGEDRSTELLCDGRSDARRIDSAENQVWPSWPGPRLSPKSVLGEGLSAAVGWQCVAAVDRLQSLDSPQVRTTQVIALGCNQQAIAARFTRTASPTVTDR